MYSGLVSRSGLKYWVNEKDLIANIYLQNNLVFRDKSEKNFSNYGATIMANSERSDTCFLSLLSASHLNCPLSLPRSPLRNCYVPNGLRLVYFAAC